MLCPTPQKLPVLILKAKEDRRGMLLIMGEEVW
jgi:hypothetical protein